MILKNEEMSDMHIEILENIKGKVSMNKIFHLTSLNFN